MSDRLRKRWLKRCSTAFYDEFKELVTTMVLTSYNNGIKSNPRSIMYKLMGQTFGKFTVAKGTFYTSKFEALMNLLKLDGAITNDMTIDVKRTGLQEWQTYDDIEEWTDRPFHLDHWRGQKERVLFMCEASGYAGIIENLGRRFQCPYVASGGDMGNTIKFDVAEWIAQHNDNNQSIVVLYFGDDGDKGYEIPQTIENDLKEILGRPLYFRFVRVLLLDGDCERYGITEAEQFPEDEALKRGAEYVEAIRDEELYLSVKEEERTIRKAISMMVVNHKNTKETK